MPLLQVKLVSQFRCDGPTLAFWERAVKGQLTVADLDVLEGLCRSVDSINPRHCLVLVALKTRQMWYHNELFIQQRRLHTLIAVDSIPATDLLADDDADIPLVTYGCEDDWRINNTEDKAMVEETAMPLWPMLKLRW